MNKDVTSQVEFEINDGEILPFTKCICGEEFSPWNFTISIYDDDPDVCPKCGRKYFFQLGIRVFEVVEES